MKKFSTLPFFQNCCLDLGMLSQLNFHDRAVFWFDSDEYLVAKGGGIQKADYNRNSSESSRNFRH